MQKCNVEESTPLLIFREVPLAIIDALGVRTTWMSTMEVIKADEKRNKVARKGETSSSYLIVWEIACHDSLPFFQSMYTSGSASRLRERSLSLRPTAKTKRLIRAISLVLVPSSQTSSVEAEKFIQETPLSPSFELRSLRRKSLRVSKLASYWCSKGMKGRSTNRSTQ